MPKRIDLDDDDSSGDLEEALRQLQRRARKRADRGPEPGAEIQEDVQEAVLEIGEVQREREAAARRPRRAAVPAWAKWLVSGVVIAAVVVTAVVLLRPEPLPPPAASAEEAVTGFWTAIIQGKYEAAIVYCPDLITKYGSREQAAEHLREQFSGNRPVRLSNVGQAQQAPDSNDLHVSYEIYLSGGTPRAADAIVVNTGDPKVGYVIIAGI